MIQLNNCLQLSVAPLAEAAAVLAPSSTPAGPARRPSVTIDHTSRAGDVSLAERADFANGAKYDA